MLATVSTQTIAEKRAHVIIKIGDFRAFSKEWILVVDLYSVPITSTSIVIRYSPASDSKAYAEDLLEIASGLEVSSLLARILHNLCS